VEFTMLIINLKIIINQKNKLTQKFQIKITI
jgi:hypothetical protein